MGQAIQHTMRSDFRGAAIPWTDPVASNESLTSSAREFLNRVGENSWCVIWAAGSGTVGTDARALARETEMVRDFATMFSRLVSARKTHLSPGLCVLISSAGGVYAGAPNPPYSNSRPPQPISDYGREKLAQEDLWKSTFRGICPTLIARLSNVYGEAQRIHKRQGLISQLAFSAVTHQPLNIYVPLDTVRDYIHAEDAARLIAGHIADRFHEPKPVPEPESVIVASGDGTSIATLLRMMSNVCHRRVPIAAAATAHTARQARDSRFIPDLPTGFTSSEARPLAQGLRQVYLGVLGQLQQVGAGTQIAGR